MSKVYFTNDSILIRSMEVDDAKIKEKYLLPSKKEKFPDYVL